MVYRLTGGHESGGDHLGSENKENSRGRAQGPPMFKSQWGDSEGRQHRKLSHAVKEESMVFQEPCE